MFVMGFTLFEFLFQFTVLDVDIGKLFKVVNWS